MVDENRSKIRNHQNDMPQSEMANIYEFYKNSTVLITGGTGFLGKVLVEKLLRCFEVKKVILLVRNKKGENAKTRLENFTKESIFDRLREQQPTVLQQKLYAINVNFDADDLDIAKTDIMTITNEVDVVLHAMASVKFTEKLKDAININILGTKRVLDLAKQIRNLKAFLHVSTCYTQCHRSRLEEKIDVSSINCQKLLEMTANLTTDEVEVLKDELMDSMPNTYTLTKRYAEELVSLEVGGKMPIGIFRPPILGSTYKQPVPGWTDNVYGPMSLSLVIEKGYIHCVKVDESKKCNAFPIDYCVDALIAAMWDVGVGTRLDMPIYNYLYNENNCTWKDMAVNLQSAPQTYPLEGPIWHKFCYQCDNQLTFTVLFYLFHLIPGFLLDCVLVLARKKRKFIPGYMKYLQVIDMNKYFAARDWEVDNGNIQRLDRKLKDQGITELEFDVKTIDWTEYFQNYIPGFKKYYFKESFDNLDQLRMKYRRLKYLHYGLKGCLWMGALYLIGNFVAVMIG